MITNMCNLKLLEIISCMKYNLNIIVLHPKADNLLSA